ncbi:sphingomyelin phosphodiesterase 4-like isoform X2 [Ptychodera flava]|uniref:sphingomyelin phosphodiesterase 4-like isoform X2 n=1 Tax=Ptychodera flava TaxID=63121 RepID=UPI00396A7C33
MMAVNATTSNLSVTTRFQLASSRALKQRCEEVTSIINDSSVRDLHAIFPLLLESLFGFNNSPGWGLKTVTKQTHPSEFQALRMFLSPQGSLMTMVSKLQSDNYLRYDFLVSCLPAPSRHAIQEGVIPLLYGNKFSYQSQGRPANVISLNAFEYFLFHFAYYIVYPKNKNMNFWSNPTECIYPTILEDYMNYFLPIDNTNASLLSGGNPGSSPGHSPQSPYSRKSPSFQTPHGSSLQQRSHSQHYQSPSFSGLIRGAASTQVRSPSQATMKSDPSAHEQWRSETFAQILAEFWLNQNSLDVRDRSLSEQFAESFRPSHDHVRVVRMMVKHLHYFANSAKDTTITSPYQQHIEWPLDDLKRTIIPHIFQKKLYAFLRHGFDKWPLDASFRLMLETWLSFIQPWRYVEDRRFTTSRVETKDKSVPPKWSKFIADNLLFYTTLFIDFLPRAYRQDLSASKNALMLFRVSKIYATQNLAEMIEEAEGLLYEQATPSISRLGFEPSRPLSAGGSFLSPVRPPSSAVLKQQLAELEGQGFIYKPLFAEEMQSLIQQLLGKILHAQSTLKLLSRPDGGPSGGFMHLLGLDTLMDLNQQIATSSSYRDPDGYDDPHTDVKKVDSHLHQALQYLSSVFKVDPPTASETSVTWGSISDGKDESKSHLPDMIDGELTPLGRYQLANGLRKFDIVYQGDPDLQPIRSFENPALVRLLYRISSSINTQAGDKIEELCSRTDMIGRLAKQYFSPPSISSWQPYLASSSSSPICRRKLATLKPRLSLRFLGSYQNIGYILGFFMFCYVYNIGFVFGIVLVLFLVLLYGLVRVLLSSRKKNSATNGQ